ASPLIPSGLTTASALTLGGSEAQKSAWLPKIADGSVVATLAVDVGPHLAPAKVATTVSGGKLNGKKTFVLEGPAANLLIVSAKAGDKIELYLVKADAAGVERQKLNLADSRGAANITFKYVAVSDADKLNGGAELLEKVLDRARAGLAAEMLGAATQAFETTLDYLKTRVQFGQVIGSFQALQHRAAKMFTELELSRSTVEAPLAAVDNDSPAVAG